MSVITKQSMCSITHHLPCCNTSVHVCVIPQGWSPDHFPSWSVVAVLLHMSLHVVKILMFKCEAVLGCRRDSARLFSYEEVSKWGAGGQILLERLLPELAFKLGRASKYGA